MMAGRLPLQGQNYSTNGFHIKASDSWRVDALLGGSSCFDFAFYADRNPDLPLGWGASALWQHFARSGQFEPRPFRCGEAGQGGPPAFGGAARSLLLHRFSI